MARSFDRVTVTEAEAMYRRDFQAMKRQYTEMRDIAQKRIKRLEREFSEAKAYTSHTYEAYRLNPETGKYQKVTLQGFQEIKNIAPEDFAKAFSELSKFVSAKGSTIKGQRAMQAKTMESINKSIGAKDEEDEEAEEDEEKEEEETTKKKPPQLTKANYWRFIKILEESRRQKLIYDSNKMVEAAEATLALDKNQFNDMLDHLSAMLEHSDELADEIASQTDAQSGMLKVDMSDFIKQAGWS